MARRQKVTSAAGQKFRRALAEHNSPVKVKGRAVKARTANDIGKNRNGSWTSNGSLNQGYDRDKKQFTRTSGRSMYGRLAESGATNAASARTHTMSYRDENGERKSGRGGQLASRRQRYYDVRKGLGLSGG